MRNKRLPSAVSDAAGAPTRGKGGTLSRAVTLWIADGQAAGWRLRTVANRRDMLAKFGWWLEQEGLSDQLATIDVATIRFFLAYLRAEPGRGRWGSDRPNAMRLARPSTVDTFFRALRAFFNFAVREGLIAESPCQKVSAPRVPKDQIQPFTPEQAQALVDAARESGQPFRNLALVLLFLDTGLRVSEVCSLTVGDVDPDTKAVTILGKGGKRRVVYLSPPVRRALWRYVERERRMAGEDEPLFVAVRGRRPDAGLTPNGVGQLFRKLGQAAGIRHVRCSPHTARHYYATMMLRNGVGLVELQLLMGHECLATLRRYLSVGQADLALVHRKASPAARLKV